MSTPDRSADLTPPWSVPVPVIQIPETGLARDIEATPEQRQGMAVLGGILSVDRVRAELLLVPVKGGTVHVTGRVFGRLAQSCVVTLDPIESDFDEPIDLIFAPASQIRDLADSVDEDIEGEDDTPDAKDLDRGWGEIAAAAAVQGAVFGTVKALVDRAGAKGFQRATGVWPGNTDSVD